PRRGRLLRRPQLLHPRLPSADAARDRGMRPDGQALLSPRGVTKSFGGVAALSDLSLDVAEGEILGIIGPNGAGKTTLLNCISGVYRPDAGDILWQGASIAGRAPHRVAALGIGRTFQVVKPFTSMTVRENAAIGALFGSSEPTCLHGRRLP